MRIIRIINNNVVMAQNAHGQECVVIGKGIGYSQKVGGNIDQEKAAKVFTMREKGVAEKLSLIIEDIPIEHVRVCDEIINTARTMLLGDLNEKIYLTLIDHISFAIDRHSDGVDITSSLKLEMKQFYPDEYAAGLTALDIIEKRMGIRFPDDEAAFIAFHLVNAGRGTHDNVEEMLRMSQGILAIVKKHFNVDFDEESISYNRFLTHLKFFSLRIFGNQAPELKRASSGLIYRLQGDLPEEYACVEEIAAFVRDNYGHTPTNDEKAYLVIHLHSMLTR